MVSDVCRQDVEKVVADNRQKSEKKKMEASPLPCRVRG
jgi:hypothetical protein